jgi:hypothetical protein
MAINPREMTAISLKEEKTNSLGTKKASIIPAHVA